MNNFAESLFALMVLMGGSNADTETTQQKENAPDTHTVETENSEINNFTEAKKIMPKLWKQLGNPKTLYCGCPLHFECGYKVRKNAKRAARIEAEHMMPAWEFGHQMDCWRQGGRKKCTLKSSQYQKAESDLHNLWPALGEVNGDRSNFQYSDWNAEPGMYGKCEMVVDFKSRRAQPPKEARGIVARAYLYMAARYDVRLSDAQRKLYESWNRTYAPNADECLLNRLIERVQGNDNPLVSVRCPLQKDSGKDKPKKN